MFNRRLVLLAGPVLLGLIAPASRLAYLTVVRGAELHAKAEKALVSERLLPTIRGKILDRKGRVLAQDRPSFDIAVNYRLITGQWAFTQALKRAKRAHRPDWVSMSREQRLSAAEAFEPDFQVRLEEMWDTISRTAGIGRDELEQRKAAVIDRVSRMAAMHVENKRIADEERLSRAGQAAAEVSLSEADKTIREEVIPHVLLNNVDNRTAFAFLRLTQEAAAMPKDTINPMRDGGLEVVNTATRDYPLDLADVPVDRSTFPGPLRSPTPLTVRVEGVATHVVGWVRGRVLAEDKDRRPMWQNDPDGSVKLVDRGGYDPDMPETIGAAGIEEAAEATLRGLRGLETRHFDTGEVSTLPAEPGKDVRLTIDAMLQARIQALFATQVGLAVVQPWHRTAATDTKKPPLAVGTALAGAAVVIDIDSGAILALVSYPSFSHATLADDPGAVFKDPVAMPWLNRAISQRYAPGSIVKPLVLCAATTAGLYTPTERIECTGHFFPDKPHSFQCWTQKQFHTNHTIMLGRNLDGCDGIMGSCNIFFFEMGRRLGPEGITDWYTRFGVGRHAERWRLGLDDPQKPAEAQEYCGHLPDPSKSSASEAILMGIGQGPIDWTPLHAADVYATVARYGVRIVPRLREDVPVRTIDLHLDPRAVEQALEGLRLAVADEHGTSHHLSFDDPDGGSRREPVFDHPQLTVRAKSGTADAAPLMADTDQNGVKDRLREGDHSWCVLLVGPKDDRAKYAVASVVDFGGSGGRVAGPLANQIIRTLIDEGYLPPAPPIPAGASAHQATDN